MSTKTEKKLKEKNKQLRGLNKQLRKENTALKEEVTNIKREVPNKNWFTKLEDLKSMISNYESNFLFLITLFLTVITIKPDQNILNTSPNLRWIISGVLFLMLIFHCKKNSAENEIAKFFKKRESKSFWWGWGNSILINLAVLFFILWVWINKSLFLWVIGALFVVSLISNLYIGRKYGA